MDQTEEPSAEKHIRHHTARALRLAKRHLPCPVHVKLSDGRTVAIDRFLRILPGKRITGEGRLDGARALVKLFIAPDSARHWKREIVGITTLKNADIPTPRLIAAEKLNGNGHVILTEFLDPSETLADTWDALPENSHASKRAALLAPALTLMGRLHASGLLHNDIHTGNFLHHSDRLFIIDGDAVRRPGGPVCERKVLANLVTLLVQLPEELPTLLEAYKQGNPSFSMAPGPIQQAVQKKKNENIRRSLKKSVRDSTRFAVHRNFRRFTSVLRKQEKELLAILADPDKAVETGHPLKNGNHTTVARIETSTGPLVIKRYNLTSRRYAFSRLWRPSRAWKSWKEGLRLQLIGLQTPQPLAMIENRFGPLRRNAWLITEFCDGIPLLEKLPPNQPPTPEEQKALLHFFNTLFSEQVSHGDFKATNLLWHKDRISVIDLDAMKKHRFAVTYRRAWKKDRARLLRNWPEETALHRWLDANLPR